MRSLKRVRALGASHWDDPSEFIDGFDHGFVDGLKEARRLILGESPEGEYIAEELGKSIERAMKRAERGRF